MNKQGERIKFIELYNDSMRSYKKYKKDYLIISFIHYEFKKVNPDFNENLISAKLHDIINTYRVKHNKRFDKEKYVACAFVWENINEYLLSIFSILSENKILGNEPYNNLGTSLSEIGNLIDELSIGHLMVNKFNIKNLLKRLSG